ncbi:MAG: hypothetical protein ACLQDY_25920 [Streptosporangiaceae bacterium]
MPGQDDVRRLALELPGVVEATDHFGFFVPGGTRPRGFAWAWRERTGPKKARVESPGMLAVRAVGKDAKERLLASDTAKVFTEPHYNRFPAVLVRLQAIDPDGLQDLLAQAWTCMAPRHLVKDTPGRHPAD